LKYKLFGKNVKNDLRRTSPLTTLIHTSNTMQYKEFDQIEISTKTVIAHSNLSVNLEDIYKYLPVHVPETLATKLKNKKAFQMYIKQSGSEIPYGSILKVQYENKIRGFTLLKAKNKKFFRNVVTVYMYIGKMITIKIPKQGKIQMTGCKVDKHAEDCIRYLWKYMKEMKESYPDVYALTGTRKSFYTTLLTVMSNINFNLGFWVNREELDTYINQLTSYNSLLETSFGYTGVNIKLPFDIDPENNISFIECVEDKDKDEDDVWEQGTISYIEYLANLSDKDKQKEIQKKRRNTFLVFHSGTAIMSGMSRFYMKDSYNQFIGIIKKAKARIEEQVCN